MKNETAHGVNNALAWIALIIAIVALILGWTAFNRTGEDLGAIIETEVNQALEEAEQGFNEAEEAVDEAAQEVDENVDVELGDDASATE